jgi:hypothetical protein
LPSAAEALMAKAMENIAGITNHILFFIGDTLFAHYS